MGYMHISNLYRDQTILLQKEVYALEKIHGTSAHISWKDGQLHFFAGGESHENFKAVFDEAKLIEYFTALNYPDVVFFGEAYGGKQQGQAWRYGKQLKFVVFEAKVDDFWLAVPDAQDMVQKAGLEFVDYVKVPTDLTVLNLLRDAPSTQAKRNGVGDNLPREGVVLRPIVELKKTNGERLIAKHKRDEERETKTPRKVVPVDRLEVLKEAQAIAEEWVTDTRFDHVLQALNITQPDMIHTRTIINGMIEDVRREGEGEFEGNLSEICRAIGHRTAQILKQRCKNELS